MLIKIIDNLILESHLEDLKNITGTGSASKSVSIAASNYLANLETIRKQSNEIHSLNSKLTGIVSLLADKQGIQDHIDKFLIDEITL
jgi:hypothetical protein